MTTLITAAKETSLPYNVQIYDSTFDSCIRQLSNSADQLKFYLFADDTHMLYADRNLSHLKP